MRPSVSPPISSLATSELRTAAKDALLLTATQPLRRVQSGWYTPGKRVTLRVADQLIARGLARIQIAGGRHQLVATGSGRMVAAVIRQRRAGR